MFFRALKWSAAGEIVSKAFQPLIFIILARLLTPEDYGVTTAALMIISLAQVFWEAGMNKALIQRQTDIDDAANIVFWTNIGLGILFSIILFLFAQTIAINIFQDSRVTSVLRWMTLQLLFGALGSVHIALLQKKMEFSKLFWVRITTIAIPGLFSIPLALYGMGYWSIVVGTLLGQAFQVIFLWYYSNWRPAFSFNISIARDLMRFGLWVGITGLLVWFYLWADSFVVGAYLGTHELGLFRTANSVVLLLFDVLFAPLLPVLYSYFSGISEHAKIHNVASTIIRIIAIIAIPLAFILFSFSTPLSNLFFGDKWAGIAFIISYLGLMRGYGWLVGINGEIYRAVGKPHYETLVYAFSCVFFIAGYIISIKIGFKEFIFTRLALGMLSLVPHFYILKKVFKSSIQPILRTIVISTFAGLMTIIVSFTIPDYIHPILYSCIGIAVSLSLVALVFHLLDRKFFYFVLNEIRSKTWDRR